MMATSVTITTGARLHFGLLVGAGSSGPVYRSVGMMITDPGCALTVRRAERETIAASPDVSERIASLLSRWRTERPLPPVQVDVAREIPAHAGLGSGTQLGLALGMALTTLCDPRPLSVEEIARLMERGRRSSIGRIGFARGGFLVTGVKSQPDREDVIRHDVAAAWRVVLVTPGDRHGLSGADELRAFQQLPPMTPERLAALERLAVDEWAPAMRDGDFHAASDSMFDFGMGVGQYFAPVQGGVYADPAMDHLAQEVRQAFGYGVAQTSWGPTLAILCPSEDAAVALTSWLNRQPSAHKATVRITEPLNRGAKVDLA